MNIAMIGSRGITSNYGGIEKVLDEICPRLVQLGHKVDVYAAAGVRVDAGDLQAIPVGSLGGKHFDNITRSALATLRALGHYDVVHFHAIGPGVLSLLTAMAGQKSAVTIHGLDWRRAKWNAAAKLCLQLAQQALVRCADGVTVVSRSIDGYYRDRYGLETAFIPNGMAEKAPVPLGEFGRSLGLEEDGYLLFASRLVPEKGCHDLIEAFAQVPTGKKLVIAGAAGEPAYIERLKGMADPTRVVFAGQRTGDELAQLFSNAHMFVLPSYIEGMSNALLEALAYRRPVLVSDIEENAEVVEDYGFYFRTGDVGDLARQIGGLLVDTAKVARMQARLAFVRRADWDAVARGYESFYRELIAGPAFVPDAGLPATMAVTTP